MAEQPGVVLYNKSKFKPFQATMYHSIVCAALRGGCLCTHENLIHVAGSRRVEANFRIQPRCYSAVLPEEVLLLPQVRAAMKGPNPQLVQARELQPVQRLAGTAGTETSATVPKAPSIAPGSVRAAAPRRR